MSPVLAVADVDTVLWVGLAVVAVAALVAAAWWTVRNVLVEPVPDLTGDHVPGRAKLNAMVGKIGKTVGPLSPAGLALIQGERVYVTTGGEYIEAGRWVGVTQVLGIIIYVRPVADHEVWLTPDDVKEIT